VGDVGEELRLDLVELAQAVEEALELGFLRAISASARFFSVMLRPSARSITTRRPVADGTSE
jgi:hypothetical protein